MGIKFSARVVDEDEYCYRHWDGKLYILGHNKHVADLFRLLIKLNVCMNCKVWF